ncbi:MAG: hypothetical protein ACJ74T_08365 [Pyrinomonadaceae bacterium]
MQCPTCDRELADQTHCEICDRQDVISDETASVETASVFEDAEQVFTDDSNVPSATGAQPQAADSPEDSSDEPTEQEPSEVPEPQPQETALPPPMVETASSDSIDSKGEQSILGQAFQNIGDVYQTEIGGDVRSDTFHVGPRGDFYPREIGDENQAARDSYTTGIGGVGNVGMLIIGPYEPGLGKAEEVPLYSLTQELPQRTIELHESAQAEVREKVAQLKATRLMFITCPYAEFAVDAGHVAIGELGLSDPARKRLLNYEDTAEKNLAFTARNLLKRIPKGGKEEKERALLVYAHSDSAQPFLDSFFDTPNRTDIIRAELQRSHLLLIVIAAPRNAQNRFGPLKRTQPFAYAEIPFLRPFLRGNFPEDYKRLEADINKQRARGKWEKDEAGFCQQVIGFYETERLEDVVAAGGPDDPRLSAESLLKGSGPVEKSVLYAAAFFQEITTPEFCLVVEALLDGCRAAAPPSNGGAHAQAQAEVPLGRIWQGEKDRIFNEQLRETAKDSVRVVTLSDSALREPLQNLFEKRHRLYLIDQLDALQERGIFFHPSIRLADNAAAIAVRVAADYPDKFNENWVVDLVSRVRRHFDSDPPAGEDAMFQFLRGPQQGAAFNLALAQVAAVLRGMHKSPRLRGIVQSSLEQLVKGGYHEDALLLVNHLQFAPEFDALYWFKQLLHRADNRTRHFTYYYLYAHLKRMGGRVYEGFKKVETWLPKAEPQAEHPPKTKPRANQYAINAGREHGSYSPFDHFVLRLLIQYCIETVARFNAKHYGEWPTRYPLLAVKDGEEAAERTSLIARWLLHPGIETTLVRLKMGGTRMTLIGALLAEWAFILLGPKDTPSADDSDAPSEDGVSAEGAPTTQYSAAMLFDLLVWQFTSRTNPSQRLELLKYWNKLNSDLLKYASGLRGQFGWKRELVGELITRVKSTPTARESPPAAYGRSNGE